MDYEKLMLAVPLLVHCHSSAENLERKMKRVLQILHFVQDDRLVQDDSACSG